MLRSGTHLINVKAACVHTVAAMCAVLVCLFSCPDTISILTTVRRVLTGIVFRLCVRIAGPMRNTFV